MADNARTFCFLLSTVQSKLAAANSAAFFFFLMLGLVFDHPFLIIGAGLVNLVAYRASDSLRGCFCHGEVTSFRLYVQSSVTLCCTNRCFRCEHTLAYIYQLSRRLHGVNAGFLHRGEMGDTGFNVTPQQCRQKIRPDNEYQSF